MLSIKNMIVALGAFLIFTTPAYASDNVQIDCMARNALYEAGNQGERGMIAVSQVVMNRTRDKRFPTTPCGVIHQKKRGMCQFSWVCQRRMPRIDMNLFQRAKEAATRVYYAQSFDMTRGALFYHANYVHPKWASLVRTASIGDHIFYRG